MTTTWKKVADMSTVEVVTEAYHLADMATMAREMGDGIATKDTLRFNDCIRRMTEERLESGYTIASLQSQWNPNLRGSEDMIARLADSGITLEAARRAWNG